MNRFQPGEIVDITITGARVVHHDQPDDAPHTLTVTVQNSTGPITIPAPLLNGIDVVRKSPAEWPPQPGDLWLDRDGRAWFAYDATDYDSDEELRVAMCGPSSYNDGKNNNPETVNQHYGPMSLAHRAETTAPTVAA